MVAAVLPISAAPTAYSRQAGNGFDSGQVLGMLVAELAFDPQPQRRTVTDRERLTVQAIGDDRLWMKRIDQVDALVIWCASQSIGTAEHNEARLRQQSCTS